MTAQRAPQAPIPAPSQGLVLRPPVPGAHNSERKRTPSLFERITGAYNSYRAEEEEESRQSSGSSDSNGGFHSGLRAPQGGYQQAQENVSPSQGKLNIDSPAAPQNSSEEDLDIPAFLRRQAN
jgi:cell division protein FtsZ